MKIGTGQNHCTANGINPVGPLGRVVDKGTIDTRANDLANDPAEVDVGGEERTNLKWHDLGGV